jgi:hypothetical protein
MSLEFVPQAPKAVTAEDVNVKNINWLNENLEGKFLTYKKIADEIYDRATPIAARIDTQLEESTSCVFDINGGAVRAASLLTRTCIRGAQLS